MALILCLFLSVSAFYPNCASADGEVITKILTTISATPVALMDPASISAATSTPGCYIVGAAWFDAAGNMAVGAFNAETYQLRIQIAAAEGYYIDPGAACYLNNSAVSAYPDGTGKSVTLIREYTAAVWAPTVYKQPGKETVNEYGMASFVVSGTYIRDYQWMLVNSTATDFILMDNLKNRFPGMEVQGNGTAKLMLYNIPYELNGWSVICNFFGAGDGNVVQSQPALLTVIPDPSRAAATPAPTPVPTVESAVSASATPADTDEESASSEASEIPEAEAIPEETPHEHVFSDEWFRDAENHWHECREDGERSDQASHIFVWTETRAATRREHGEETGTCEICGYIKVRETPLLERTPIQLPGTLLTLLLMLVPIDLILLLIHPAVFGKQRSRAVKKGRKQV